MYLSIHFPYSICPFLSLRRCSVNGTTANLTLKSCKLPSLLPPRKEELRVGSRSGKGDSAMWLTIAAVPGESGGQGCGCSADQLLPTPVELRHDILGAFVMRVERVDGWCVVVCVYMSIYVYIYMCIYVYTMYICVYVFRVRLVPLSAR